MRANERSGRAEGVEERSEASQSASWRGGGVMRRTATCGGEMKERDGEGGREGGEEEDGAGK